jgi:hypothetical protein
LYMIKKKKARKWNDIVDHLENNRIKDYEHLNYDFLDKNVLVVEKKRTRLVDNVFC